MNHPNNDNRYQYNGKELNSDHRLNMNDYGARWYDPGGIGRWGMVDPLSDPMPDQSPYIYAFNSPMRFVDLFGMFPECPNLAKDPNEEDFNNLSEYQRRLLAKDYIYRNFPDAPHHIAKCESCPKGKEYDQYRNSDHHFAYEEGIGIYSDYGAIITGTRSTGGNGANWISNAGTTIGMTIIWATGYRLPLGAGSHYENDAVAGAMRNAWQVSVARNAFYAKYNGDSNLNGASYTNHKGIFGFRGLIWAGLDPIEQFIGSYRVDVHAKGRMLQFKLTSTTSFKSLTNGIGPAWDGGPRGNFNQTYIFTEPLNLNR